MYPPLASHFTPSPVSEVKNRSKDNVVQWKEHEFGLWNQNDLSLNMISTTC